MRLTLCAVLAALSLAACSSSSGGATPTPDDGGNAPDHRLGPDGQPCDPVLCSSLSSYTCTCSQGVCNFTLGDGGTWYCMYDDG